MIQKKGLSSIVTAVIMVVLVLIAVGIVWSVVSNLVDEGSEQISINSECLKIDIKTTKVVCSGVDAQICNATITRGAGGISIGGVKLIYTDPTGTSNYVQSVEGDITPLATTTMASIDTALSNPDKIEVIPYLLDKSGNEQICPQGKSYNF